MGSYEIQLMVALTALTALVIKLWYNWFRQWWTSGWNKDVYATMILNGPVCELDGYEHMFCWSCVVVKIDLPGSKNYPSSTSTSCLGNVATECILDGTDWLEKSHATWTTSCHISSIILSCRLSCHHAAIWRTWYWTVNLSLPLMSSSFLEDDSVIFFF